MQGCAFPNLPTETIIQIMHMHGMVKCACLDKYFTSKQRCYEEEKIAIVVMLLKKL